MKGGKEDIVLNEDARDRQPLLPTTNKPAKRERLVSLDVYRGLTMFGMIMVDNQGNFNYVYWPFNETTWDGVSTADLIFPAFMFIMGASIALALGKHESAGRKVPKAVWIHTIRRVIALFVIGVLFNLIASRFHFAGFRIMGVLQRLGIVYGITAGMFLTLSPNIHRAVMVVFGIIYLCIMYTLDVPNGCGRGNITPQCNGGAYIDQSVFSQHYMMYPNDPEGITSTLTASITAYFGLSLGAYLITTKEKRWVVRMLAVVGVALIGLACLLLIWMPLNKKAYTLNFAFFTGGTGALGLLACYMALDMGNYRGKSIVQKIVRPSVWLGMNPLFIFLAMVFLEIVLLDLVKFTYQGVPDTNLWTVIYDVAFVSWLKYQYFASSVFGLVHYLLWVTVAYVLQRKKWFFKL